MKYVALKNGTNLSFCMALVRRNRILFSKQITTKQIFLLLVWWKEVGWKTREKRHYLPKPSKSLPAMGILVAINLSHPEGTRFRKDMKIYLFT